MTNRTIDRLPLLNPVVYERAWSCRCPSSGATGTACTSPGGEVWVGVRTPGTEIPARAERIRDELTAPGRASWAPGRSAEAALLEVHDADAPRRTSARHGRAGRRPGCTVDPGQDRVVPYLFPNPGLLPHGAPHGFPRRQRPGRCVRLRHDDADRPGDVGGRARRHRYRAHRRRPRHRRRARRLRLLPAAGSSRRARLLRRLLLPQQLRRRSRPVARLSASG